MKTFTHPNKWVMAGALLVALGINVPFKSQHPTPEQSADFASTLAEGVVHGKIYTPKGVVPVKYIDNGEDQVLAIIPKKMTEGQICDNCGYESIALNVKNKSDIDALNVALLQAIQNNPVSELPQKEVAGSKVDSNITQGIQDPFETILKACARYKERAQKLDCTSDRYVKLLSRKDSNISAEDAMSFYQRHIEGAIRSELSDSRRLINKVRRASMDMSQWQALQDSDDMLKNPAEMREETLKVIRGLLAGVPSQYESVRKRLVSAEVLFATEEAKELELTFKNARDNRNPSESVYLFKEAEMRRQDLQALLQDMSYHTSAGLSKASSSDFINRDLQAQYEKFFSDFATKVQNGMWTNPYDFMGGTVSPLPTVPNLDQRQRNPGRGVPATGQVGVQGGAQAGPALSGRTGMSQPGEMRGSELPQRNGTTQQGTVSNLPQRTFSGSSRAPMVQGQGADMQLNSTIQEEYTNNGVSFGTVGPASAESLRERAINRGRQ